MNQIALWIPEFYRVDGEGKKESALPKNPPPPSGKMLTPTKLFTSLKNSNFYFLWWYLQMAWCLGTCGQQKQTNFRQSKQRKMLTVGYGSNKYHVKLCKNSPRQHPVSKQKLACPEMIIVLKQPTLQNHRVTSNLDSTQRLKQYSRYRTFQGTVATEFKSETQNLDAA